MRRRGQWCNWALYIDLLLTVPAQHTIVSSNVSLFTVNVESVGAMAPDVIFIEAVKILRDKCKSLLDELSKI